MALINIPSHYAVRVRAVTNAGMKQVYSTAMIYGGGRVVLDEKIGEEEGVRPYIDIPEDWILEVVGGHYDNGFYRDSNESPYNQGANPVIIGYDDSGGPGVDFSNLVIFVEKVRRTRKLNVSDYSVLTSDALQFLKSKLQFSLGHSRTARMPF